MSAWVEHQGQCGSGPPKPAQMDIEMGVVSPEAGESCVQGVAVIVSPTVLG